MSAIQALSAKIPVVKTCCCGCTTLRMGTLVICGFMLVSSVLGLVTESLMIAGLQQLRDGADVRKMFVLNEEVSNELIAMYSVQMFCDIGMIFLSAMAMAGAGSGKSGLLIPWLFGVFIEEPIQLSLSVAMLANREYQGAQEMVWKWFGLAPEATPTAHLNGLNSAHVYAKIIGVALGLASRLALKAYFFFVVHSLYRDFRNQEEQSVRCGTTGFLTTGSNPTAADIVRTNRLVGATSFEPPAFATLQAPLPPPYENLVINR